MSENKNFAALVSEVRTCTICAAHLPLGPRPIVQIHPAARILIAGQAPGRKVHESGVPFDDASGKRLREWMGVTREIFYSHPMYPLPDSLTDETFVWHRAVFILEGTATNGSAVSQIVDIDWWWGDSNYFIQIRDTLARSGFSMEGGATWTGSPMRTPGSGARIDAAVRDMKQAA